MIAYYMAMLVFAIVNLIVFILFFREKKLNYYILAIFTLMAISNAGAYLMAISETLREAYLGKKIYYMGACFSLPIMLTIIFKMCNINIKKWVENVLFLYSFVVYGFVLTIGYNKMYYVEASLTKVGDATVFVAKYGFFIICSICCFLGIYWLEL